MKIQDIFPAVKRYWDSDAGLAVVVPGGLWWGKPKQTAAFPYCSLLGKEEDPEFTSGTVGIQRMQFDFTVYSMAAVTDAAEIQRRLGILMSRNNRIYIQIQIPSVRLLDLVPVPSELDTEGTTDAQEVIVARASYRMMLQVEF